MSISPEKLEEKLASLRKMFRTQLTQDLARMEDAWREIRDTDSSEAIQAMRLSAHSLSSTSALFGLETFSASAKELEVFLLSCLNSGMDTHAKAETLRLFDTLKNNAAMV